MSSLLFGNGTDIVHWKPSSETRGTFDILSTCIITMLLCVWTAVHLNVSPPGNVWTPRLRKVGWMILALLAPELVAYTAWYQRRQALSIMRVVNDTFVLPNPPSWLSIAEKGIRSVIETLQRALSSRGQEPIRQLTLEAQRYPLPQDRHPWTMTHGFYATMGGIAFEIPENITESKQFLPSHSKEVWFISHEGIHFLSEQAEFRDMIPNISREEIESRSKANGLAKILVCIQALWFIIQCVTRLAQGIPISLLELNTFGHAVCMLLVYFLWWEKPFEVDYPSTIIEGQILWNIRALHSMQHDKSFIAESFAHALVAYLERDPEWQASAQAAADFIHRAIKAEVNIVAAPVEGDGFQIVISEQDRQTATEPETGRIKDSETDSVILGPGEYLTGTCFRAPTFEEILKAIFGQQFYNVKEPYPLLPEMRLSRQDIVRWKMAWRAVQAFKHDFPDCSYISTSNAIKSRCENWPETPEIFNNVSVALGFSAAAFIYGGLHALAWSAHFDSSNERLLWRVSACAVMGGIPVVYVYEKAIHKFVGFYHFRYHWPAVVLLLAYVLARAYLVVECFINLFNLPAGVYDVPRWAAYFPHIS
ncbi:hypothetical protein BDR22DRAFT_819419 [Usnea florida]